jgi:hypothetical protein
MARAQTNEPGVFSRVAADPAATASLAAMRGYAAAQQMPGAKEPAAASSDRVYGSIWGQPWRQSLPFTVWKSTAGGAYDRVAIDLNRNGSLADDEPVVLSGDGHTGEIQLDLEGKKVPFVVEALAQGKGAMLSLRPKEWMQGSVRLPEGTVPAVLYDSTMDGRFASGDVLLLDRQGTGRFTARPGPSGESPMYSLGAYVMVDGKFYSPRFGSDGTRFDLDPYTGPVGTLAFEGDAASQLADASLTMSLVPAGRNEGFFQVNTRLGAGGVKLPVGEYGVRYCRLNSRTGGGSVQVEIPKLSVAQDGAKIRLDKPALEVSVKKAGDGIAVDRTLKGDGIVYKSVISGREGNGAARARRNPEVTISALAKPDAPIAAGHMEYG